MMEYSIRDKQIHFKTINDLRNPYVWCDTTKLQQVLVNVLNNAVKFTPQNGTITLKCTEYPVSEAISEYTISIKDTGIGMDKDFQKHAFEAFERERTSTESQIEGTGLGLSIVKKLMDLMNGQVTIQSELHQGTEICIKLQLKKCEKSQLAAIPNVSVDSIDFTGSRVLLVEDNSLNAEIAIEFLTNAGLLVDWVKDGCSCIEQLEHAVPAYYQFILMDIQMPRMNGYDATRKIRQMEDTEKAIIPIIAMTANAFDDDRKSAFAAGMNGFIAKPIELDKILQAISEIYQTS